MFRSNVTFPYSPRYAFIFPFEESFDKDAWQEWMRHNWPISIYFGIAYLISVYFGRVFMKSREKYDLTYCLATWNAALAIFSIMGTLRTTPEFFHTLFHYGYHFSACNRSYADYNPISGFWGWLFVMSKIPEFLDTAFIVLRKQKLIFLHWYHHLATALFLWYGYTDHSSTARWIFVMNYSVHAIMYSYYAFRVLKFKIPKWISMFITVFQITQMIFGSTVFGYVYYIKKYTQTPCDINDDLVNVSMGVYLSYFALFVNFFIRAYIITPKPTKVVEALDTKNASTPITIDSVKSDIGNLLKSILNFLIENLRPVKGRDSLSNDDVNHDPTELMKANGVKKTNNGFVAFKNNGYTRPKFE